MRKIVFILMLIPLLFGCRRIPETYQFANTELEIKQVELLSNASVGYTGQEFTLVRALDEDEISDFMDALYKLETKKCTTPPPRNFGPHIVRVTYENGDMELFASWHIEFVENGKAITGVGAYYFSGDAFETLYSEYANKGQ